MNNPYYESYWNLDEKLEHHGVLGMRWGIRRYQPYPKGKHGTFLGQSRDEDIRIKKGTEAYRVQGGGNLEGDGQSFVSLSKLGHYNYTIVAASGLQGIALDVNTGSTDKKLNSLKMVLKNDVIMPSYEQTMDSFIKTVGKVGVKKALGENVSKESANEFTKYYGKKKVTEARDAAYMMFMYTMVDDTKAKNLFFKDLASKGYNAIIDETDHGFGDPSASSKVPIIIFDKQKDLTITKADELSDKEIAYMREIVFKGMNDAKKNYPKESKKWDDWISHSTYHITERGAKLLKENPFYEPYWDTELEHHGIKGMKWGVRRTPEQLGYKKKKKSGGAISSFKKKVAKRKAQAAKARQKKKAQTEKKQEQLTEKQKEELREKLLKSTDAKFLAKHIDLLDTKEIKERMERIDTEKKLKNLAKDDKSKKQIEKGMEWVDNIKKIAEATEKAATAYTKVIDAKDKVSSNETKKRREAQEARDRREATKKLNKVIKDYSENQDAFSDIEIDFDPKTGKMNFKSKRK